MTQVPQDPSSTVRHGWALVATIVLAAIFAFDAMAVVVVGPQQIYAAIGDHFGLAEGCK